MDPQKIVVDMLPARPIRQVLVSYSATLGIEIEGSRVERLSLASLKGPGRCQKHGTTSRPHRPADAMISAAKTGVKWNGVAASKEPCLDRER